MGLSMIDLHSHTSASDGQYAPREQVALAARAGVKVLAITDHDTLAALPEARERARELGVELISGIEVSCAHNRREVHVLGHFVDPSNAALLDYTRRLVTERETRMTRMIERLVAAGVPVSLPQVQAIAGDGLLTRPHLARALVESRVCATFREAFDRFLGDGKLAWVPKQETTVAEAVALIHRAGGTATIAHPGSSRINHLEFEEMARAGLDGIEALHRDHPPTQRELFARWAAEFSLCVTAGSDFHGPKVAPDREFGAISMTPAQLDALARRRS